MTIENCGVVATETPVQDNFATVFAPAFYKNLIRGDKIGEALFQARWSLLKYKHNPQGVLYSAYGNPDIRVRRPQPRHQLAGKSVGLQPAH